MPPKEIKEERHIEGKGCIVIGDKGKLYGHEDYCNSFDLIDVASVPKVEFTKCPDHFGEWINAVKGGPAARVELPRLRRRTDRDHPPGQPRRVDGRQGPREEDRVGRPEPQAHQRPRGGRTRQAHLSYTATTCRPGDVIRFSR